MPENPVLNDPNVLRREVAAVVNETPVIDFHTHLFPPSFEGLNLWGIDELVRYHYLIAELFRSSSTTPDQYWAMTKEQQADLIWDTLFVRNTPISEAARGVVCVMNAFGLDPAAKTLADARKYFASVNIHDHIANVMGIAGVSELVMTNDPFNDKEAAFWREGAEQHPKFNAALRMDPLINDWPGTCARMFGSAGNGVKNARKFLDEWIGRMKPRYMAVSLTDDFLFPDDTPRTEVLRDVVLPTSREHGIPFAMMIGVRRQINPKLGDAGDGVGRANLSSIEYFAREFPENRFFITLLSRENQHEMCVIARKFGNIMPFGCWWFLNNPSIIREITSERVEMLGTSMIPQHSDCRILEQLVYKWVHSRRVIADVLADNYANLVLDGYPLTREHIQRDVTRMFSGNFEQWVAKKQ